MANNRTHLTCSALLPATGAALIAAGLALVVYLIFPVYHNKGDHWWGLAPYAFEEQPAKGPPISTAGSPPTPEPKLSLSQRQRKYWPLVRGISRAHGLDPALVMSVIHQESRFQPRALSPRGAIGMMQILPATAEELGLTNPMDPKANIQAGVAYLAWLKKLFQGNLTLTLAAYNAGPTKVLNLGYVPHLKETQDYVVKVMGNVENFRTEFSAMVRR